MADPIRAGLIGVDTSHCAAYTRMLNDEKAPEEIAGVRIVAAYPSFSPDVKSSAERVEGFKKQLTGEFGVEMVDSIEALVDRVDAILLTSVDGRRHLPELRQVVESGKPVYIDKPFSASLADAKEMVRLIRENKLPCFSTSSLRYDSELIKFMADMEKRGKVLGCDAWSPAHLEPTNPGFFWYGVHGTEILYTVMGRGCTEVQCSSTPDGDLAVGIWKDGSIGSMRGIRKGKGGYGAMILCEKTFQHFKPAGDFYAGLVREIVKFFRTKKPPVPIEDTLEICAFMDAALRSSRQDGADIPIEL
jgi:hypothetical protein